eukprot:g6975.t1
MKKAPTWGGPPPSASDQARLALLQAKKQEKEQLVVEQKKKQQQLQQRPKAASLFQQAKKTSPRIFNPFAADAQLDDDDPTEEDEATPEDPEGAGPVGQNVENQKQNPPPLPGSSPAWNPGSWAGAPGANNRQQQQSKREVRGGKTLAEVNSSNSQDQANQEAQALKKLREAKAALKEQPKTWYQLEAERELQKSIEEAKANKAGGVAHQPGGDRDHDAAGGVLGGPDAKRPKVGNPSLMGHLAHSARATGWGQAQGAGAVNGGAVNGGTKMPSPVMPRPPAPASGTSQHSTPAHTSAPPPPPPENGFLGKEGRAHLEHHKNHDDSLYDNFSLKEAKEALKFIKEQNLVERPAVLILCLDEAWWFLLPACPWT